MEIPNFFRCCVFFFFCFFLFPSFILNFLQTVSEETLKQLMNESQKSIIKVLNESFLGLLVGLSWDDSEE